MSEQSKRSRKSAPSDETTTLSIPSISAFEAIRHIDENGQEYWWARELMPTLSYNKWQDFYRVIQEAMEAHQKSGGDPKAIFMDVRKDSPNAKKKYPTLDYKLTRHACYLIVLSADGRKEVIALAKSYFAVSTRLHELAQAAEDRARLELTPLLFEMDAALSAQAFLSGANTKYLLARFWNAGYRGLYLETASQIRARKRIKPHQLIDEYSSSSEVAALTFKASIARATHNHCNCCPTNSIS